MPLFSRDKNRDKDKDRQDKEVRQKTESRRGYRLDKIKALTAKAYAVATKRKWLVFMLGLAIILYFIFSSGGFGGLGGLLEKVKGFF